MGGGGQGGRKGGVLQSRRAHEKAEAHVLMGRDFPSFPERGPAGRPCSALMTPGRQSLGADGTGRPQAAAMFPSCKATFVFREASTKHESCQWRQETRGVWWHLLRARGLGDHGLRVYVLLYPSGPERTTGPSARCAEARALPGQATPPRPPRGAQVARANGFTLNGRLNLIEHLQPGCAAELDRSQPSLVVAPAS